MATWPSGISFLVPAFRCQIQVMISSEEHVETPCKRGVREEHLTLSHGKHTDTRKLLAKIPRVTCDRGEVVLDPARWIWSFVNDTWKS